MRAAIVVDDWKLPVFRKALTDAGLVYEDAGEAMPGITALTVVTDDLLGLKTLLEGCQRECLQQGKPTP